MRKPPSASAIKFEVREALEVVRTRAEELSRMLMLRRAVMANDKYKELLDEYAECSEHIGRFEALLHVDEIIPGSLKEVYDSREKETLTDDLGNETLH